MSWISRGPSIEIPTRNSCSLKKAAQASSSLVPLVWTRVLRPLPRGEVVVDELDGAVEELEPHQRRLAPLPSDLHDRNAGVRLDQLTDIGLEQLIGHPEAAARIQHLLGEEEAVGAVEVADRTCGLREQMKGRGRIGTYRGRHRTSPRGQTTGPLWRGPARAGMVGSRSKCITVLRDSLSVLGGGDPSAGRAGLRGGLPGRPGGPRAGHFSGRSLFPRRPRYRIHLSEVAQSRAARAQIAQPVGFPLAWSLEFRKNGWHSGCCLNYSYETDSHNLRDPRRPHQSDRGTFGRHTDRAAVVHSS